MPPTNERVAAMVRAAIAKNPQVDNAELRRRAADIDRAVRRLSPRQFHATYRLPALRSVAVAKPAAKPAAKPPAKSAPKTGPQPAGTTAAKLVTPSEKPKPLAAEPVPARPPATATPMVTPAAAPRPDAAAAPAERVPDIPAAAPEHTPTRLKALARPHAAEREAVRAILQLVAREALATDDRAGFVRLLDSLDERAAVITGLFARA
jgi:hypothetical protein